jgi:hypothetical protein
LAPTLYISILLPAFYFTIFADNILLPFLLLKHLYRRNWQETVQLAKSIPLTSIFFGGISIEVFFGVLQAGIGGKPRFRVTQKGRSTESLLRLLLTNKFSFFMAIVALWNVLYAHPAFAGWFIPSFAAFTLAPLGNELWERSRRFLSRNDHNKPASTPGEGVSHAGADLAVVLSVISLIVSLSGYVQNWFGFIVLGAAAAMPRIGKWATST